MLTIVGDEAIDVFAAIASPSLATGEVPEAWRAAVITPLDKRKKVDHPSGYRPVAVTSLISRSGRLNAVIRLSLDQHGFRRGFSVGSALSTLLSNLRTVSTKKTITAFKPNPTAANRNSEPDPNGPKMAKSRTQRRQYAHKSIVVAVDFTDAFTRVRE